MLVALPVSPSGAGQGSGNIAWIDLMNPTPEERAMVESDCGVRLPSREDLSEVQSSSRLVEENGVLIMSIPNAFRGRVGEQPSPLGFVLSQNLLVTLRYAPSRAFDSAARRLSRSPHPTSTGAFATLVEEIVESTADRLEDIAAKLDRMSHAVFRTASPRETRRGVRSNEALRNKLIDVGNIGERLSQLRSRLVGLQRILPFVRASTYDWIPDEVRDRLRVVEGDSASLAEYQAHLSDKIQFLLDAVLGFISTKQNDIFTVLTIVSVIGIPPMLVASIYGMNFKNMPELDWVWGYPFALSLIALSTILPVLWFRWRGWL